MRFFRTAVSMTAEGPTKRRTLVENYAERSSYPTRVLSPRQLPTDHVTAVSTRAYQCDQSSRLLPGCYRHPCPEVFPFALLRLSLRGAGELSRIHVVALRASLTAPPLHQTAPLIKTKGKTSSLPQQSRGLDRVAPYQFSEGAFSAWSTIRISIGALRASSLRPS
jgi:hypothetical protein